jgi:hypothetical protein
MMAIEGENGDGDQEQSGGDCRQDRKQGDPPTPAVPEQPPFQAIEPPRYAVRR